MVAHINTVAFQGIDVLSVDVQVHMAQGLPAFTIVGLPNKAVSEAKERVRAALSALGLALPPKRITVNLSPADTLKEGSHFDLPIALGLLTAMDVLPADQIEHIHFAVLKRIHRSRINIKIGIEFLDAHLCAAFFKQRSQRSGCKPFSE